MKRQLPLVIQSLQHCLDGFVRSLDVLSARWVVVQTLQAWRS